MESRIHNDINFEHASTEFYEAFNAFQKEMSSVSKNATNPHHNSKYADLASIMEQVSPVLQKNNLVPVQFPLDGEKGFIRMYTRVIHILTGQYIEGMFSIPAGANRTIKAKNKDEEDRTFFEVTPHTVGSAITYGRRYSISTILGIITDNDDDGNAASVSSEKKANPSMKKTTDASPVPDKTKEEILALVKNAGMESLLADYLSQKGFTSLDKVDTIHYGKIFATMNQQISALKKAE